MQYCRESVITFVLIAVLPRLPFRQPSVTAVHDESVDLEWTKVDVPATQYDEAPLTFIIESQRLPGYDWSPVARGVRGTSYKVTDLQRHQDYSFRVRGELPYGLSEPSPSVSVYRRPSESTSSSKYRTRSRDNISMYHEQVIGSKHTATTTASISTNTLANQANTKLKSAVPDTENGIAARRNKFLAEIERLDLEWQQKHLKRMKPVPITKPPMSPRSRKERFESGIGSPRGSPKQQRKSALLDKINKFEQFVHKPVVVTKKPAAKVVESAIDVKYAAAVSMARRLSESRTYEYGDIGDTPHGRRKHHFDRPNNYEHQYKKDRLTQNKHDYEMTRFREMKKKLQETTLSIKKIDVQSKKAAQEMPKRPFLPDGNASYAIISTPSTFVVDRSMRAASVDVYQRSTSPSLAEIRSLAQPMAETLRRVEQVYYHEMRCESVEDSLTRMKKTPSLPAVNVTENVQTIVAKYSSTTDVSRRDAKISSSTERVNQYSSTASLAGRDYSSGRDYSTGRDYSSGRDYSTGRDYSYSRDYSVGRDYRYNSPVRGCRAVSLPPVSSYTPSHYKPCGYVYRTREVDRSIMTPARDRSSSTRSIRCITPDRQSFVIENPVTSFVHEGSVVRDLNRESSVARDRSTSNAREGSSSIRFSVPPETPHRYSETPQRFRSETPGRFRSETPQRYSETPERRCSFTSRRGSETPQMFRASSFSSVASSSTGFRSSPRRTIFEMDEGGKHTHNWIKNVVTGVRKHFA